jgi:hypothetical protein
MCLDLACASSQLAQLISCKAVTPTMVWPSARAGPEDDANRPAAGPLTAAGATFANRARADPRM